MEKTDYRIEGENLHINNVVVHIPTLKEFIDGLKPYSETTLEFLIKTPELTSICIQHLDCDGAPAKELYPPDDVSYHYFGEMYKQLVKLNAVCGIK